MRWTIGLALGFAAVIAANIALVWFSTGTPDPIAPSYQTEAR